jgi:hypothetical protein
MELSVLFWRHHYLQLTLAQSMKSRIILALGCLVVCSLFTVTSRADDRRFSSTLSPTESAQIGLPKLSSDHVAVLDALVRKDLIIAEADPTPTLPRAAQFSQRISADERRAAGFALLGEIEIAQIDAGVERFEHPVAFPSATLTDQSPRTTTLTSVMLRRAPEIHGSVTLMVAGGSGGYSAYGGAINLSYYDPAHHFSLEVGYSEIRSKGGYGGYCNGLFPDRRQNNLLP